MNVSQVTEIIGSLFFLKLEGEKAKFVCKAVYL